MTGEELTTFITGLNGGATIDPTLLSVLINTGKSIIEEERPWMCLRKTNSALNLSTGNTWQTAKSLSTITDFGNFYGEFPIRLFDGSNRVEYYRQVPFDRQLEYKDVSNTFCYYDNTGNLYFNGVVPFSGTLYLNYSAFTSDILGSETTAIWSPFPSRFVPLLGFYAIGTHKGAVDYDDVVKNMLPENRAVMMALKNALETWDAKRQQSAIEGNDPTSLYNYPRSGAIDLNG